MATTIVKEYSVSQIILRFSRGDGGGGDSLIKVGTDVRAQALGISAVNFCPGIRFWEINFARALGF